MSKAKFAALLGLVESDEEDSEILLSQSAAHSTRAGQMPPAKKGRRAIVKGATKAAPNATRASTRDKVTNLATGRKALAETTANAQPKSAQGRGKKRAAAEDLEMEDAPIHDEDADEAEVKPKTGRGRPRATKAIKLAPATKEIEPKPEAPSQPTKRGRKPKVQVATPATEREVPETQPAEPELPESQSVDLMEESIPIEHSIEDEPIEGLPSPNCHGLSSIQRISSVQRASSVQRPHSYCVPFSASRRPIAASDSELNDPATRRRIGDLSRKYESLEVKYRDLREIGVKEAERNFDKLKKQGEERAKTATDLITTLKAQLAAQTELAKEGQRLKQQLEANESKMAGLQDKVTEMTTSLSEAKTESKALSTKLAASRATEASNVKVPGSAMKGNVGNNRLLANAEAAIQAGQVKENLYSDLTGLIVCNVKKERNEEVYDCIQTGRNGTLHFKLSIGVDNTSDEEAQFMYMPQLDANRDRDLIEVLPDYLAEEITFPRPHAAKFYSRVMKALTERLD